MTRKDTVRSDTYHSKRRETFESLTKQHGWRLIQDATMRILDGSSLYDLAWHTRHYENYVFGEDWEYADVGFTFQRKLVHYGVMSVKLPRKLPNVVFDSLRHQRRQFRPVFDDSQRIQLEGNFDAYFATYFGEDYEIDDLSFITPEVMEALIEAQEYDIEIIHDTLLLFGPTHGDPGVQLQDMAQKILAVRKKLLNNILTYRDERVPGRHGRKVVAREGMFLDRRTAYWTTLTGLVLKIIFWFFFIYLLIGAVMTYL